MGFGHGFAPEFPRLFARGFGKGPGVDSRADWRAAARWRRRKSGLKRRKKTPRGGGFCGFFRKGRHGGRENARLKEKRL
jgi:hypothetical protein